MHDIQDKQAPRMLSFASSPVFSNAWDHRPAVSSPLSSSPIRPSSPLSPVDSNARRHRQIQSSPIKPIKFKYASRPARPNPVVRRREDAQETRRRSFLQNVRQKAEEKAWQRRDIEGQFLKTNWLSNVGRLSHDAPILSDADIEDAMTFQTHAHGEGESLEDIREEDELQQMIATYEEQQLASSQHQSFTEMLEDNDEYDDIFQELVLHEPSISQHPSSSNQMEMD